MPRTLELKPDDLPIAVRLIMPDEVKEYILLKTKQDKLLLNRSVEHSAQTNR